MNAEERGHVEQLLEIHRAHLRELETQQAKLGILAPSGIALQIAEHRHKIAELEEQLSKALPRHNLPPRDYERFVGRQKELADVRKLLLPYPKSRYHLVTIDGIGGIGKSALALETAHAFRDQYAGLPEAERFEAIVWVSAKRSYLTADGIIERRQAFRTVNDLYSAMAQVMDYPAITRAKAEDQRAIVERVLAEQRTLLILDNLETVDDEDLLVFLRELPDPTKAIVTTRHRIDVAYPVRLTGMPHEDALGLIEQESARKSVSLSREEQEELWQRTGGVPLAIVWSIGLMGLGGSIESVLRRLGSGQSDIARFCFKESVAQVRDRDGYWLLLALSLFATDASREALGVVAGLGKDEFGRDVGLEDLLRLSLVNKNGDRFGLLPLTRSFVISITSTMPERMAEAQERWRTYFFDFADNYGGWTLDWQGHDQIERDLHNMLAVFDSLVSDLHLNETPRETEPVTAEIETLGERLLRFIPSFGRVCRLRGYWSECDRLSLAGVQICRLLGNSRELGWRYYDLSRISFFRGDIQAAAAWAVEARNVWSVHWPAVRCFADRMLGLVALEQGNLAKAEQLLSDALRTYDARRSTYALSNFLESMGLLREKQGNLLEAIDLYRQAVDSCRQTDNLPALSANLLALGVAQITVGNANEARQYCEEALKIARQCSRADVIARALYQLGILDDLKGRQQDAEQHARQALDLFRRLGIKRGQAEAEGLLERLASESSSN